MQIEVKGRNVPVTDELREHVEKRFAKVGRQVSELARLEVELSEERNPAIADCQVAEATLHLKGVDPARAGRLPRHAPRDQPLRATSSRRQVKRHRDKRRKRREARAAAAGRSGVSAGL